MLEIVDHFFGHTLTVTIDFPMTRTPTFKKTVKILKKIGFKGGNVDPCLMSRHDESGLILIALYVDDCLCCGHEKAIKKLIKEFQENGYTLKIEEDMTDYLSCQILFSKDKKKAWLGQPHLIKNLKTKFGKMVQGLTEYVTPGTPGQGIVRPDTDGELSEEDHALYRSGVGMLLYLVKHSRPDIANVTRELSKVLDRPTQAAFKELKRAIKFVLDTEHYGLAIIPRVPEDKSASWELKVYSDSDWAGDKDTRISVSGFGVFLMGVPISWKSKAQRSVTLSSSEAELVALTEAAKEIKFIAQLLMSMGFKVNLPIVCKVDNQGAIFMAQNVSTSQRTKHLDLRYRFITEYIEDGFIKVIFVRTKENVSDWFTKNVTSEIYNMHKEAYIMRKEEIDE